MSSFTTATRPGPLAVCGMPVDIFESYDAAVSAIAASISSGRRVFCAALNPEKIARAMRDSALRRVLESADLRICDGVGVSLAAWLLYRRRVPRVTGIELFLRVAEAAAREGWSVFLLGASAESNAGACRALTAMYPGLKIAGAQSGFFENSGEVVARINASGADLLFVAMGSPHQEFWISEHLPELRPLLCMGVGGALDVLSGAAKWAPPVFRRTGTEWLFRLCSQPSRVRRQAALPKFALAVLREAARTARSAALGGSHAA